MITTQIIWILYALFDIFKTTVIVVLHNVFLIIDSTILVVYYTASNRIHRSYALLEGDSERRTGTRRESRLASLRRIPGLPWTVDASQTVTYPLNQRSSRSVSGLPEPAQPAESASDSHSLERGRMKFEWKFEVGVGPAGRIFRLSNVARFADEGPGLKDVDNKRQDHEDWNVPATDLVGQADGGIVTDRVDDVEDEPVTLTTSSISGQSRSSVSEFQGTEIQNRRSLLFTGGTFHQWT